MYELERLNRESFLEKARSLASFDSFRETLRPRTPE